MFFLTISATNSFAKDRKFVREYTSAELRAKYERLNTSVDRVNKLKKRGYLPRTVEEAKLTVEIAEKEFGKASLTIVKPLLVLADLLGRQKRYEEAEQSFAQMYTILESGEDATSIYSIGYRIRIARLYMQWNKFEKAESTLVTAQEIIQRSRQPFDGFTQSIHTELKKIYMLKEINSYNSKKTK